MKKAGPLIALIILFLLHQDIWFQNDHQLVLGIPVSLAYHVGYCVVVSLVMGVLVTRAWPFESDSDEVDS